MRQSREVMYENVPVTDGLAAERTFLAAERTLLAYARTAFALFLAGVTGVRLLEDQLLVRVGYVLAVTSPLVLGFGLLRFRSSARATRRLLSRVSR